MNPALLTAFWRQRLVSPLRVVVLAALFGLPLLTLTFIPAMGFQGLGSALGIVLVVAAGAIGQDVSSGVLQILLVRPIPRPHYVLGRWLGVALMAGTLVLAQVLIAWLILTLREVPVRPNDVLLIAGSRVLEVFGVAAILTMLSSLVGGYGDVALYLLGTVASGLLGAVAQFGQFPWLGRAVEEFGRTWTPTLPLAPMVSGSISWFEITSFLSSVAIALTVAIWCVNRKELSYASG